MIERPCKRCSTDLAIDSNCYISTNKNGKVNRECKRCSKERSTARQKWRRQNEVGFRVAQARRISAWRKRTGDATAKKRAVERDRERMSSDVEYRITRYLRNRLRDALAGKTKSAPTLLLLGCPVEYLKNHLESLFQSGMSWDNYGDWHIDHIIPCAHFDLTEDEDQKRCFHWTNLQPLWAKDNREKSDKFLPKEA